MVDDEDDPSALNTTLDAVEALEDLVHSVQLNSSVDGEPDGDEESFHSAAEYQDNLSFSVPTPDEESPPSQSSPDIEPEVVQVRNLQGAPKRPKVGVPRSLPDPSSIDALLSLLKSRRSRKLLSLQVI